MYIDDVTFEVGDRVRLVRDLYEPAYDARDLSELNPGARVPEKAPVARRLAKIVAFARHPIGHLRSGGVRPGMYYDRSFPVVQFEDGRAKTREVSIADLVHEDPRKARWRERVRRAVPSPAWRADKENFRYADLPETTYWEGDHVLVTGPEGIRVGKVVVDVDYATIAAGKREATYGVADRLSGMPMWMAPLSDVRLIERGNVWRHHHGKPLRFRHGAFEDELEFHVVTGRYDGVVPSTIGFRTPWNKRSALSALALGEIDWMLRLHGSELRPTTGPLLAVRFFDRDFGARANARAATVLSAPTYDYRRP